MAFYYGVFTFALALAKLQMEGNTNWCWTSNQARFGVSSFLPDWGNRKMKVALYQARLFIHLLQCCLQYYYPVLLENNIVYSIINIVLLLSAEHNSASRQKA